MELITLTLCALITSSISAVIGMGGGIILLAIMAIIIPDGYMAIALHGIIQMFSNGTRTFIFRNHLKKQLLWEFFQGSFIGLGLSTIIIYTITQYYDVSSANQIKFEFLKPIIGIYIIWYLYLKGPKKKKKNKLFRIVGLIGGISSVFIGAAGPLIAPFFLRDSLHKKNIIANKAACQLISHFGKIPIFMYLFDVNYINEYSTLIPLIISVYIGTNIGKKLLNFIPEKTFKILFKVCLTIISIRLILDQLLFFN